MKPVISNKLFTIEKYVGCEWAAEKSHEFIDGQLFKMSGENDINN